MINYKEIKKSEERRRSVTQSGESFFTLLSILPEQRILTYRF